MGLAALSRTDVREESRRDFYMYLDEFQSFTTLSLANMLSELRKYRVGLILAHQYLSQLDLQIRDAILGNVGTMIAFRLGLADAEILETEFRPEISALDLISLPNYHIYVKLLIDGVVSAAVQCRHAAARNPANQSHQHNNSRPTSSPAAEFIMSCQVAKLVLAGM